MHCNKYQDSPNTAIFNPILIAEQNSIVLWNQISDTMNAM